MENSRLTTEHKFLCRDQMLTLCEMQYEELFDNDL